MSDQASMGHAAAAARAEHFNSADTELGGCARDVLQVLVVDDVAINREVASYFLRAAGHQVICLDGGAPAVSAVAATDFDLVLMDVRMPEMDGLEATRRIRALKGARGKVPIVALTAQGFRDQVEACRKAGMNGHVSKPFDPETLIDAVVRAAATACQDNFIGQHADPGDGGLSPSVGSDLPIIAPEAFARVVSYLEPTAATRYLQTVVALGEALLRMLHGPPALAPSSEELAAAAHTLAASAGMFGCERLTAIARRYQLAIETEECGAPDAKASKAASLADSLSATIGSTLHELRNRLTTIAFT